MIFTRKYKLGLPVIYISLLFAACLAGCAQGQDNLIRQLVEEKVRAFRERELAACRQRLLEDAERLADSLLLEEARADVLDSLNRTRPLRPPPPAPLDPIDSATVHPIFPSNQ